MAPNSLYPAFVVIDYHSLWGAHKMTIPTRAWDYSGGTPASGAFADWEEGQKEADVMVNDLVDELAPFFLATTTFDLYTIYTMASATAAPTPVYSAALGIDGTSIETEQAKGVQTTFTFRTDLFGIFKLVLLDAPAAAGFDRILSFDASPAALAVLGEVSALANAWAGRDGGRPNTLVQIAYTLNEKLRREYNMN
jgi:hypothetical protein